MAERAPRFDVVFHSEHTTIDAHHCRSWEPDENGEMRGCYGTNPDHGLSFEEACDEVAQWYEEQARLWRSREHPDCKYYLEQA